LGDGGVEVADGLAGVYSWSLVRDLVFVSMG
jgi:hypothetical protein